MIAADRHRDRGGDRRAATIATPVVGHARARAVRGRRWSGSASPSAACSGRASPAPAVAILTIVTWFLGHHRRRRSTCRTPSTSSRSRPTTASPMLGQWDAVGHRRLGRPRVGGVAGRRVGLPAARPARLSRFARRARRSASGVHAANVRAWTPSSSRSSWSAPASTSRGTSGSRPPATRSGLRPSGCSRHPSASSRPASPPGGWTAGRRSPSRVSRSASCPGVVEAVYFVLLSRGLPARRPVGRLPDRARDGAAARGRRSVSGSSANASASPDRIGVALLLVGFLVLQRPWRALQGHGFDPSVAFALATGVSIAAYTRHRSGRGPPDRHRSPTPRSCG